MNDGSSNLVFILYKGGTAPQTKIEHIFCAILKILTLLLKKMMKVSRNKLSEKLKIGIQISVGQTVLGLLVQNMQNTVLIKLSRTMLTILREFTNMLNFGLGCSSPLANSLSTDC